MAAAIALVLLLPVLFHLRGAATFGGCLVLFARSQRRLRFDDDDRRYTACAGTRADRTRSDQDETWRLEMFAGNNGSGATVARRTPLKSNLDS